MTELQPHALASLFPGIPDDELQALADDIRAHGQREPVLTFEGKVLDGWNRVRACRLIGRKPWLMEFDPVSAKMTPEALVISANLRRRHLSVGQMSAIVVELSERIEREGGNMRDAFNGEFGANRAAQTGRPKAVLTAAAEMIGIDERRGREAGAVKTASAEVFRRLKRGVITLHEAMEEIRPPAEAEPPQPANDHPKVSSIEADEAVPEIPAGDQPEAEPLANKPAAPRLSRKERIAGAWLEVERVFGGGKYTKWLRDGRLTDDEALEFEKLASDADKKQVRAVMLQNRSFREAVDSLTGLNPQNTIEDLHTKTVQSGGSFVGQIGEFLHVVAFSEKGRAELLTRLEGWPAK
jgi:ParB-like chromosome segregation protein Spo0J